MGDETKEKAGPAAEIRSEAEGLIPLFRFERILNLDQNGRRIALLGNINDKPALLGLERAAFPTDPTVIPGFLASLMDIKNLGANDIYHWYMASQYQQHPQQSNSTSLSALSPAVPTLTSPPTTSHPQLKLNLIYPCTEQHIKKYSSQVVRMVTETPEIYIRYVRPFMQQKRQEGRLNWVFNIIEGRTEQEDVIFRDSGDGFFHQSGRETLSTDIGSAKSLGSHQASEGFLLLPDLNWDRTTIENLHLLALVERCDLWSLRDLRKSHMPWLRRMKKKIIAAAVRIYGDQGVEEDMLKLYLHCKLARELIVELAVSSSYLGSRLCDQLPMLSPFFFSGSLFLSLLLVLPGSNIFCPLLSGRTQYRTFPLL